MKRNLPRPIAVRFRASREGSDTRQEAIEQQEIIKRQRMSSIELLTSDAIADVRASMMLMIIQGSLPEFLISHGTRHAR